MSDKWKIQKLDNDCNCNRCKYIPEVFALLKAYPHTNMHHNTIADIFGKEDAEYIVKAVNEYDSLVAEISHLKKVNGSLEVDIDQSERRNEQLRQLACERCKQTGYAFACRDGNKTCVAYKEVRDVERP